MSDVTGCIIHDRYQLVEMLGCGSFGAVYKAIDLEVADDSDNIVALKIMRLANRNDAELAMIEREVIMHDAVSGIEGVVTLLDTFDDEMWCCLVLQYCSGGDLFDQSITKQVYQGNDELLRKAFLSIVDAVQGCHDSGIAHRDLKPENIFTSEDGSRCYLGDFSLAANQPMVCDFGVGTRQYMSPECIGKMSRQAYDPYLSDIWSLGIVLCTMVLGGNPWKRATYQDTRYCQFLEDPDFLYSSLLMSAGAQDIIQSLLSPFPEARMSLSALREAILSLDTFFHSPSDQIEDVVLELERQREYTAVMRVEITPACVAGSDSEDAYMAPEFDIPCAALDHRVQAAWDCSAGSVASFPSSPFYHHSSRSSSRTSSEVSDGQPVFTLDRPITVTAHVLWDEVMAEEPQSRKGRGVDGW
ncbi:hypothetical protein V8D89_011082 [Ganoderma adspersum]